MTVTANGKPLFDNLDVIADAGGSRTADVRKGVYRYRSRGRWPASPCLFLRARWTGDVVWHRNLPESDHARRPVRIVTRDVPYYSNDSHWWSPDLYFKGGQLSVSEAGASGTDDPESR